MAVVRGYCILRASHLSLCKHGASRSGRSGPYVRDPPLCLEEPLPSHAPVALRAASFASPFWATVASAKAG